jgi:glycosyltransferase involved in cell wall biosynthesis
VGSTSVSLRAPWPTSLPRPTASFLIDGEEVVKRRLSRRRDVRVQVPVDPTQDGEHRLLEICTESFSPSSSGDADTRQLGAFISAVSPGDLSVTREQIEYGCLLHFVDTYQHVVAVSHYAASWARRLWGTVISSVVHPPVTPPPGRVDAHRTQSIVVLGRFYGGPTSKKQLDLVRAFAALCDSGLSGWDLQVLGGVNDEKYVNEVEAAGAGYPVEVVRNASGALVEERLATARLAWQATGWGEDPDAHPDRFEHFGIALVEAMGAGAIPVALETGGPSEIVTTGRDGFLWSAGEGPGPATLSLVKDPSTWPGLAARARQRANDFSRDAFEAALERELMTGARRPA